MIQRCTLVLRFLRFLTWFSHARSMVSLLSGCVCLLKNVVPNPRARRGHPIQVVTVTHSCTETAEIIRHRENKKEPDACAKIIMAQKNIQAVATLRIKRLFHKEGKSVRRMSFFGLVFVQCCTRTGAETVAQERAPKICENPKHDQTGATRFVQPDQYNLVWLCWSGCTGRTSVLGRV